MSTGYIKVTLIIRFDRQVCRLANPYKKDWALPKLQQEHYHFVHILWRDSSWFCVLYYFATCVDFKLIKVIRSSLFFYKSTVNLRMAHFLCPSRVAWIYFLHIRFFFPFERKLVTHCNILIFIFRGNLKKLILNIKKCTLNIKEMHMIIL